MVLCTGDPHSEGQDSILRQYDPCQTHITMLIFAIVRNVGDLLDAEIEWDPEVTSVLMD